MLKLFPFTYGVYPGFKLFFTLHSSTKKFHFGSQILSLGSVPLNSTISFVFNSTNTKMTFSKSSGCSAVRRKNIKKTKLIYVELSSKKLITLKQSVLCVLSPIINLFLNKNILGKWGTFLHNTKRIHVRGVAKNPVDHPNGGRTKSKQPELSP